ncbi:MFS polyamine transporter [Lentinula aciculospora]|uniref:MFS polyamine transporter n=1 Tax=Lentinula aciculospora TaxID=153920 RepID=A0A9W9DNF0_9AGAR|nr:MFS polyamine transporter [Lentinula aciculospora]
MPNHGGEQTLAEKDKKLDTESSKYPTTVVDGEDVERCSTKQGMQHSKSVNSRTNTLNSQEVVIVDWDSPDDPKNPKNWRKSRKWAATLIVALFTFVSPVASAMIAPGSQQVADEFGITSNVVLDMITSIFVLGFAIGPLFMGPLSELYGRSRVVQLGNAFFLVWNFACGFAQNQTQLIMFRFFAGIGGSAPLTIGGAVIGDTFHPEERGRAIAIYALGPMIGPAVGPVIGAWIAARVSWRWVFWSTTVFDVAVQAVGIFLLQETFAPVLLERKARRLAKSAKSDGEKGTTRPLTYSTIYEDESRNWVYIVRIALTRPFVMFFREPILQLLGVYMAFIYGIFYVFITTIPDIFTVNYGESIGIMGLNYFALGLGMMFASWLNSRSMDKIYIYFKKRNSGIGEPEYRVPTIVPASLCVPVGIFMTGWAAQAHVHWFVVDLGIFFVGAGMILAFQAIQIYIVDVFTLYAASGIASVSCLRSFCGFGFPLFGNSMFNSLGYGKGSTVLACVAIAIGCPAPWILWFYGRRIRSDSKFAKK